MSIINVRGSRLQPPQPHPTLPPLYRPEKGSDDPVFACSKSSSPSGGGSKKAIARTSIDLRGGASGGEEGSVKAVWKTKRGPSSFLSYTLNTRHSSLLMYGYVYHSWAAE